MKISDVIKGKPNQDVVTIGPDATVRELVALLAQHNVGALVVSVDGAILTGIVSERDVVRHTCTAEDPVPELMQTMTEHRIRHVPVVAEGRLTGIISIGDVVKSRIGELEFERDQLDSYVHQT